MKKPIFLVDCDGVLADLHGSWFALHNAHCNICTEPLTVDKVLTWDVWRYTACGKQVYLYLLNHDLWRNVEVIPGARSAMHRLSKVVRPVVVTSITSGPIPRLYRVRWIRAHFHSIDPKDIVITNQKWCVQGDIILDDCADNLALHSAHRVVLHYPWNRDFSDAYRAFNWHDVESHIYTYLQGGIHESS